MLTSCRHCHGTGAEKSSFANFASDYCRSYYAAKCSACANFTRVQRKVDDARRILDQALAEREELVQVMNSHHDPMRRLPTEIVTYIFADCLPHQPSYDAVVDNAIEKPGTVLNTLLTLGQVCRRWRVVLESSPQLWAFIPISISQQRRHEVLVLHALLQRSAKLPLSFRFEVGEHFPTHHTPELRQVVDEIICVASRLQRLDLVHVPLDILTSILRNRAISSIHMQTLSIQAQNTEIELYLGLSWTLDVAPRQLMLSGMLGEIIFDDWSSLTHLHCHEITIEACLQFIRHADNLIFCHIGDTIDELFIPDTVVPVEHATLHTFKGTNVNPLFWQVVTFPSLRSLDIEGMIGHDGDDHATDFLAFIERSACRLEALQLTERLASERTLTAILQHMHHLRKLCIGDMELSNMFFKKMINEREEVADLEDDQPMLENLQHLEYYLPPHRAFSWPCFEHSLESRFSEANQEGRPFTFKLRPSRSKCFTQAKIVARARLDLTPPMVESLIAAAGNCNLSIENYDGIDIIQAMRRFMKSGCKTCRERRYEEWRLVGSKCPLFQWAREWNFSGNLPLLSHLLPPN